MTQLNLLPDVKLEFLRSTRQKRLVVGISLLVAAASLAIVLILASIVYVIQKKSIGDLDTDIATYNKQLKDTPDLDKVLTIQNQLNSLPGLHDQKPVVSRLFGYLTQLTPAAASISQYDIDYAQNLMTIAGSAKSLDVANTFIDTLKFTDFKQGSTGGEQKKAFSNVVMSQFNRNTSGATYTITLNYDPAIFNSSDTVTLVVPNIISSRSVTEQPTDLFQTQQGGDR